MRKPTLVLLVIAVIGLWAANSTVVHAGRGGSPVGSHLIEADLFGFPIQALATYTSDGVFTSSDTGDFFDSVGIVETPAYGSWEKTGPRSVRSVSLYLELDGSGTPSATGKITTDSYSEDGFATATFDLTVEVYRSDQDPLDPGESPFQRLTGTGTSRRIGVD